MTSKAVVLAAGAGTRMRAPAQGVALDEAQRRMADLGLKALVPFHGHPFLSYTLSALADAGVVEVCLVVAPESPIREVYERLRTTRLRISFAVQEQPLGGAHALLAAEPFAGGEPVLVINSDNRYPVEALTSVAALDGAGMAGFRADALSSEGNIPAERVAAFALVTTDADGCLERIVEKPDPATAALLGPRAYVSMTCWRFGAGIFAAARELSPSARGEYELPDAVAGLAASGECVRVVPAAGTVLDLSSRADIPTVAAFLSGREVRL